MKGGGKPACPGPENVSLEHLTAAAAAAATAAAAAASAAGPHWHSALTKIYQLTDRLIHKYKYTNILIQILLKIKVKMCQ